jgi:nitrate reductase delta subunit
MLHAYEALADLLEYPDRHWQENLSRNVQAAGAENAAECAEFGRLLEGVSLEALQEHYTRTFDLNPVCALEIGYHLFGENYKRGIFLARLREAESPFALGQERQLPDFLPVVLRLLRHLHDDELRDALVGDCLAPAVGKMLEHLEKAGSLYAPLMRAINNNLSPSAASEERCHA